jgi:hypothetical protein
LFETSAVVYRRNKGKSHRNVKEIIVRRLGKFQKKHKTETSYDITTTTYKKNTLKNIATNETAIY